MYFHHSGTIPLVSLYVCFTECDPELCQSEVPSCRDDQTLIVTRANNSCCLANICSQSHHELNFCVASCCQWIISSLLVTSVMNEVRVSAVCSSCPELRPACQEGEVMTVDSNTTDHCCPVYQCGQRKHMPLLIYFCVMFLDLLHTWTFREWNFVYTHNAFNLFIS